jgi:NADH:ubiquinone oxidoreductase subunit E
MNKINKTLKTQLFVCTNNSGCAFLGSQNLRDEIKSKLIQKLGIEEYKKNVRINNSGCLGDCSEGIAACMMPQNKFWTKLKPENADDLINEVLSVLNN